MVSRTHEQTGREKGEWALDVTTVIIVVVCVIVMGGAAVMSYRR